MSDNVLNQLRNKRNRPTVEPRQDALVPKVQPSPPTEEQNSPQLPSPVPATDNPTATPADTIAQLIAELETYPSTQYFH